MTKHTKSLFIFRRDFRLEDNCGIIAALKESEIVIPAFIFDTRQAEKAKNTYFSENAFGFLIESLKELDEQLRDKNSHLYVFNGIAEKIVQNLIDKEDITAVYINKDYTPFSIHRDYEIESVCKKNKIIFKSFPDTLLNEPETALKSDGTPYTVFTPFWKNASKLPVKKSEKNWSKNYYSRKILWEGSFPKYESNPKRMIGGRSNALKILKEIHKLKNYESVRDYPYINGTSKFSAHLKFGTISIREAYWCVSEQLSFAHPLLRQLYWRDFFYHIAYHFPKVFGHSYQEKYEALKWENNKELIHAWKNGLTGFPIVDAGMRELNTTGYMHNRVRMIVASFLTKDLHIDWRIGEKYFAQRLTDYDPCLNNGNWQWAASTGCDAQPYFRIFNPWLQQRKFDPKCEYIKNWVPELKDLNIDEIHEIFMHKIKGYPEPVVDHKTESKKSIILYKNT